MPGWQDSWSLGYWASRSCVSYFKFKAAKKRQIENQNDPGLSDNKDPGSSEEVIKGHGGNSADAYQGAAIVEVDHPELSPGDTCPAEACDGRLYERSEPGKLHWLVLRAITCKSYVAPFVKLFIQRHYQRVSVIKNRMLILSRCWWLTNTLCPCHFIARIDCKTI